MGRHTNSAIARDAAILLRTPGKTPESVAGFLRASVEGNGDIPVPAPRNSEDARQATS